jgi:DNA-binding response OmpR family regulator
MVPRALVVQSRPEVARAVSASLAEAEVHAVVLTDGHAAMTALDTWDPHVVLIDLTLPPLDGWCVLAAVGARVDRPLLVVRVADASQVERAVALGADAWVDNDVHVVAAAGRLAVTLAA